MEKGKFTPGPWYNGKMGNDFQGLVVSERTGDNIAVVYDRKNTAIISAAPMMLDCLCAVREQLELWGNGDGMLARDVDEAIAKAIGE